MTALSYPCRNHATTQPGQNIVSVQGVARLHGAQVAWLHGCRGGHTLSNAAALLQCKKGG
jgi:hypothetical protein